jgi:hypothetical protein
MTLERDIVETTETVGREVEKVKNADVVVTRLLHWEMNNEVKETSSYAEHIMELIKNKQPDRTFFGNEDELGKWLYEIFFGPDDCIYVHRTWVPTPPYSWQEEELFELRFSR